MVFLLVNIFVLNLANNIKWMQSREHEVQLHYPQHGNIMTKEKVLDKIFFKSCITYRCHCNFIKPDLFL